MTLEVTDLPMITSLTELGSKSTTDWNKMTVKKTFVVGQNEDLTFAARWTDELGNPYTLSGAYCQVRKSKGNSQNNNPVLDLTTAPDGGITIDGDQWAIVFVPASDIISIEYGRYVFDMILVRDDGHRYRSIEGDIKIEQGVTFIA